MDGRRHGGGGSGRGVGASTSPARRRHLPKSYSKGAMRTLGARPPVPPPGGPRVAFASPAASPIASRSGTPASATGFSPANAWRGSSPSTPSGRSGTPGSTYSSSTSKAQRKKKGRGAAKKKRTGRTGRSGPPPAPGERDASLDVHDPFLADAQPDIKSMAPTPRHQPLPIVQPPPVTQWAERVPQPFRPMQKLKPIPNAPTPRYIHIYIQQQHYPHSQCTLARSLTCHTHTGSCPPS